jgi:hypothetical protein
MINNIPPNVARQPLMALVDWTGFQDTYDFFYLPRNFHNCTNQGQAFVNFCTAEDASAFMGMWNGARLAGAGADGPVLKVVASALQGFEQNTTLWTPQRMQRIKNPEFRPFIRPAAEA